MYNVLIIFPRPEPNNYLLESDHHKVNPHGLRDSQALKSKPVSLSVAALSVDGCGWMGACLPA